ncbi:MAG TPA: DUF455 family protein [Verrucomicrobiae bacterium]|nr:DUF455 family protein [Verrucomicrobiae bacterium]
MEVREFAERVLYATSLEEKLRRPASLTDEQPGPAAQAPVAPGRPKELLFKPPGSGKADFPGLHALENPRERGRLLHFFANHELLATELMALVLLRFPDAPAAFRKGVLQTLKDEQEHTRLYMERMRACGIAFGEIPVSGFFWRTVSSMENPMDYVSSLCLTFEQANLDFARHFSRGFARVGDRDTAALLERIYRDEIGHVAYGLKWFRRWKNPNESDWDAFCRQLKFPLSPQRAKGFSLNIEGRRAAGLDPEFIARLDVFAQSKGRTPSVFLFNPHAEAQIAHGKTFNPNRAQQQLARDLETLPQFLCREDDIVLVSKQPSVQFLSSIKQAGFSLREFFLTSKLRSAGDGDSGLANRKLGRLRPWAWSPHCVELLRPLSANVTAEKRTLEQRFNSDVARLFSKTWSAEFLRKFLDHRNDPMLCESHVAGRAVTDLEGALEAVESIRSRGHQRVVAKEAFGLAGGNALRFFEPEISTTQRRWLEKALTAGRKVVVEPWLEREVDFSLQLEMNDDGLKLCGYTGLINDARGQFQANWAESHHHKRIPAAVVSHFPGFPDISRRMLDIFADLCRQLEDELRCINYRGPIGVDAFVYRDASGTCRLKPVVEINPRYTMGRLTVELMKQSCPGSAGLFRIVNRRGLEASRCDSFPAYAAEMRKRYPLQLEGGPVARIREGAVVLNDPAAAESFLAIFHVNRSLGILLQDFSKQH